MPHFTSSYLPLNDSFRWLKGNHHGHSTVSDGQLSPAENIRLYEAAGYDFLALSEHDVLLDVVPLQLHTSMCLVPAIEVTSVYNQTLLYLGADRDMPSKSWTPREIMEAVHNAGGLFIYDHPNWRPRSDYTTDDLLDTMEGLRGMEIYTGVIERLPGEAKATDRWDRLLSKGWRVYGHATDDQHDLVDFFIAWNCVQWPQDDSVTPQGIVEACTAGRFYASTGVKIDSVGVSEDGQKISIESDADEIRWITRGGIVAQKVEGGNSVITMDDFLQWPAVPDADGVQVLYLRAECLGNGNNAAWTQPFWLE